MEQQQIKILFQTWLIKIYITRLPYMYNYSYPFFLFFFWNDERILSYGPRNDQIAQSPVKPKQGGLVR